MKRHLVYWLFVLIGFLSSTQAAFSQGIHFKGNQTHGRIPFQFIQNLAIIQVRVNGSPPLNFILDSGVGPLIITDSVMVDSLQRGDASLYRIQGRGVGPEIEAYLIHGLNIAIGKHVAGSLSAILLKDEPFELSYFLGVRIHGIIGSDFFSRFQVEMSYTKKKLNFYSFDVPRKRRGKRLPVEIVGGKPYASVPITNPDGSIDTLLLLIDTGAGHAVSLDLRDDQLGIKPGLTIPANLGIGLSGPIGGDIGRLRNINVAGFEMDGVLAAFPHYEDPELRNLMTVQNGSLGGELLRRFTILFDYHQKELYFKKNRFFKTPFEYDMAGIELYSVLDNGKTRFFVHRVEKDSPAEAVGFQVDDELLSINFKDVKYYSLNELYELLRKETKSDMIIQLRRGNELLFKFLVLKRRI